MNKETILIVDDEKDIVDMIQVYLRNDGYNVIKAYDGQQALDVLDSNNVQLVILDIMMPKIHGIEVCRRIREKKNIPIIILSAKSADMDKIMGLSTGADDYMVKPFNPLELTARVKAQLRRYIYLNNKENEEAEDVIKINGLNIYDKARNVTLYGKTIKLTKTEYEILLLMARNLNRVFSLEEIFQRVWKEKYFEGNNTVMVHIARLREKIEDNPKSPKIIKNVWGVGYKIEN
ncbi:response regulator transcription factor [Oceanirhabdus sp. W0125-5]|uniref:response regulator transcription factor n=1 Tax=Oceanirhabdus sp. W0125-5 TaxID=2999116 RepID=UPI0022F2DB0B|nr:response regulator transcription factor [Oceanirhabdus sp. W0125-5]WBW96692.1 response regulator transcription factor [Oceanirhabdus sp. W0125-5]